MYYPQRIGDFLFLSLKSKGTLLFCTLLILAMITYNPSVQTISSRSIGYLSPPYSVHLYEATLKANSTSITEAIQTLLNQLKNASRSIGFKYASEFLPYSNDLSHYKRKKEKKL